MGSFFQFPLSRRDSFCQINYLHCFFSAKKEDQAAILSLEWEKSRVVLFCPCGLKRELYPAVAFQQWAFHDVLPLNGRQELHYSSLAKGC